MANRKGLSVKEPRLYSIWYGMLHRCENEKDAHYARYGGRGICVCESWHDFETFVIWAHDSGYSESLTIDRINNNGNYEPSNCRWATLEEQANNKSANIVLTVDGIEATAKQWANLIGVSEYTIYDCVKNRGIKTASERIASAIKTGDFYATESVRRTCVNCGKEFTTTPGKACAKYCHECKAIAERAKVDKYQRKKLEEKTVEQFSINDRHYRKLKSGYCYLDTSRISNSEYEQAKQEWESKCGKAVRK